MTWAGMSWNDFRGLFGREVDRDGPEVDWKNEVIWGSLGLSSWSTDLAFAFDGAGSRSRTRSLAQVTSSDPNSPTLSLANFLATRSFVPHSKNFSQALAKLSISPLPSLRAFPLFWKTASPLPKPGHPCDGSSGEVAGRRYASRANAGKSVKGSLTWSSAALAGYRRPK